MLILVLAALAGSSPYEKCMAGIDHDGFVKSQMLECVTTDMDRADTALNERYRIVMQQLAPDRRDRLRLEERRWIDDRKKTCAVERQEAIPSPEINRMRCLVRLTDERTAYLERIR